MLVKRDDVVKFCNEYLKVGDFQDYCRNGLQVEGKTNIEKIVVGVSFSKKFIKAAISKKADMLIVHHGLFSNQFGKPPRITGILRNRLKLMLGKDINLCGYHLPLDAHPEIGNNISLIRMLGMKKAGVINTEKYGDIGFVGELEKPIKFAEFLNIVNDKLQTNSYAIPAGDEIVKRVGIISGGASANYKDALVKGIDTYICGDISEPIVREIEEVGINFINSWHYNTEKLGIKNLGNLISEKLKVSVEFIDIPCKI